MKIKIGVFVLFVFLILAGSQNGILAEEEIQSYNKSENQQMYFCIEHINKKFDNVILQNYDMNIVYSIKFENEQIDLYPQFISKLDAIKMIKCDAERVIVLLKEKYSLDNMVLENWKDYRNALENLMRDVNKPEWCTASNDEIKKLNAVFRGLENEEFNIEIINTINNNNTEMLLEDKEFIGLLPIRLENIGLHQIFINKNNDSQSIYLKENILELKAASGYSNTSALKYATAHATSRNTSQYASFSADCTNFVSQIMEAGGKQQDNTGNKNSGWWYKGRYSYSLSWTVAHNFVAYFKIYTGTTYHRQFSRDLKTGDYIALDEDQDGRIDHMGYVVQVSVIEATAEDGHIYEKYKVAQHTPDYLLWTTDEDNHWETYNCKGTYYIVRP